MGLKNGALGDVQGSAVWPYPPAEMYEPFFTPTPNLLQAKISLLLLCDLKALGICLSVCGTFYVRLVCLTH